MEFSDFQCPFCADYANNTFPMIKRDYVDRGKVEYVVRHLPLESIHPQAFKASEAAECAGQQGQFMPMRSLLFRNARSFTESNIMAYATDIGLDVSLFTTCLGGAVTAKVKGDQAEAARLGVTSTPAFLLGRTTADGKIRLMRKILGAVPYAALKSSIDDLLKVVPTTPTSSARGSE